jgi:hypothetical protein
MFKVIIASLVLLGVAVFAAYHWGGVGSFDPTAQGRKAKAALTPGMPWVKVVDAAGAPHKYALLVERVKKVGGQDVRMLEPGVPQRFTPDALKADITGGAAPYGFVFDYRITEHVAFRVTFDKTAVVESVGDLRTMADLLDTRRR